MAVTRQPTAREIGEALAERARQEPLVRELWVTEEEYEVHLWLFIDPTEDSDAERELYGLTDVVWDRFPQGGFMLHVVNPHDYTADSHRALRHDAEQISLRRD